MFSFYTVSVVPEIPDRISRLKEIANNFWFSWYEPAQDLFSRLDKDLWEEVYHNPVKFLIKVKTDILENAVHDREYLKLYGQVIDKFDRYMSGDTWFSNRYPEYAGQPVAYFSAEFGLHESHPIYSGGLGLLAGDHCKSASDLGVPLVAVGLLYRQGYFTQRINRDGWQEAEYPFQNYHQMPMKPVTQENGEDLTVSVELPGRRVYARVWKVIIGKVNLYLMDTDVSGNSNEDRNITGQLYGGCRDTRISQEIILGIGGVRALRAMGISPYMWHINEGHAAFLCLERIREKVGAGVRPDVAIEAVKSNTLFTTHTPVPAGHDTFSAEMIDYYLGYYQHQLGMSREDFTRLGWDEDRRAFNMTVLALKLSDFKNGVSRLHGQISRSMFRRLYGSVPAEEVPIEYVTNGVHTKTWMAPQIKDLIKKHVGSNWINNLNDPEVWGKIDAIPDEALWFTHLQLKNKLVNFARDHLRAQRIRNFEPRDRVAEVDGYLNPEALTIGFARRFATYKRALIIFRDLERLADLVNNPEKPIQIIFAGKAHPADRPGQELIKRVVDISNIDAFRGKIVFLENYDINVARYLVRGVDIWLNNPRRPQEASGTSGMKAAINGVVNFSVLDGWWPEAYNGKNGFAIGEERDYPGEEMQDRNDGFSLYSILENEIIPRYFSGGDGVPRSWVEYMKNSIKSVGLHFSTDRMVREYTEKYYVPAMARGQYFRRDGFAAAEKIESYKNFLRENWHQVSIYDVGNGHGTLRKAGENFVINSTVRLGSIQNHNVSVEIVYGGVEGDNLNNIKTIPMSLVEQMEEGIFHYRGNMTLPQGAVGYTVRVRPASPDLAHRFDLPLIAWAGFN
ncbi:MAG: alpha-glucan phosphorylase [Peptococcaceae bacterium BRH_c4a]|nr:MAG: alpha-glucan phosphorylase [Peptococcaceae bacterium BRH_c4a]